MSGSDPIDVPGPDVAFAAVVVGDVQAAGDDVSDVFDLAGVGSDDWLDAL